MDLYFFRHQPQRLGAYRFGVSVRLSVIVSFPGCIFVTDGRRDLEIRSYERSWPLNVPFDSFCQIILDHRKWPNLAKMSKNRVKKKQAFPGCILATDGRRDLGIGLYERSWSIDVPFDSFGQIRPHKMAEFWPKCPKQLFFETCLLTVLARFGRNARKL